MYKYDTREYSGETVNDGLTFMENYLKTEQSLLDYDARRDVSISGK
jgi:hypothetical protein